MFLWRQFLGQIYFSVSIYNRSLVGKNVDSYEYFFLFLKKVIVT